MNKQIPLEVGQKVMDRAVRDESGCWIYEHSVNKLNGYAYAYVSGDGGGVLAHRASFTTAAGRQIKAGMVIDHKCFNRLCVNPDHLREITRAENSMRKTGDDFPFGQCKWGHPERSRVRVYWKSRSYRTECAECRKEVNDRQTQIKSALGRLEYHYGIRLTRKQRAMVEEFMPTAYAAAA